MNRAWRNGAFVAGDDPDLPSITGSVGVFETILVTGGEPRFVHEHAVRVVRAAQSLCLPEVPKPYVLAAACLSLAADAPGRARMRAMIDGAGPAVTIDAFGGYPAATYEDGVVVVVAERPGHPLGVGAGRKTMPYTPLIEARAAAERRGAFDVLFTAGDGALLEGSASNLFVLRDGTLTTPPLARDILPGITRAEVIRAAARLGITSEEADLHLSDLEGADEAFLTGSLMEVVPIRAVGETELPVGQIARMLRESVFGS